MLSINLGFPSVSRTWQSPQRGEPARPGWCFYARSRNTNLPFETLTKTLQGSREQQPQSHSRALRDADFPAARKIRLLPYRARLSGGAAQRNAFTQICLKPKNEAVQAAISSNCEFDSGIDGLIGIFRRDVASGYQNRITEQTVWTKRS